VLGSSSSISGDSSITQSFTAGTANSASNSWYNFTCLDTVAYDWATATLKDDTTGTTTPVLAKTCVLSSGWTQVAKADVAGHSHNSIL
jgi:hypothetical protein